MPLLIKAINCIDKLAKETQKKAAMLSFLKSFMKYNGKPLKEMQCMIYTEMIKRPNSHLLFLDESGFKELYLYILEMKDGY